MFVKNYYLPNISIENLTKYKFKCKHCEDGDVYYYTFPIIASVLIGKITIYPPCKNIKCDVYDICNNTLYAPYYYIEYGIYNTLLTKIDKAFLSEFKKLGVKERKKSVGKNDYYWQGM